MAASYYKPLVKLSKHLVRNARRYLSRSRDASLNIAD